MKKAYFNWSGGKDSMLALHQVMTEKQFEIHSLLTSINETYERVSMHGVRIPLLVQQAQSLGFELKKVMLPEKTPMEVYSQLMKDAAETYANQDICYSIFGDIFLEDLRKYREEQLASIGIQPIFPLWQKNTNNLLKEFINLGYKAVVVCTNARLLDEGFIGRELDEDFLNDLPENVDPCGENGEFHTLVYDGPLFQFPLKFKKGEKVLRSYANDEEQSKFDTEFWYQDLLPA